MAHNASGPVEGTSRWRDVRDQPLAAVVPTRPSPRKTMASIRASCACSANATAASSSQAFTAPAPGVAPRSFEVYEGKFKCLHPTRPLSSACGDCPRRGRMQLQQVLMFAVDAKKSKCVHPGRPMSQACADCPRRGFKMDHDVDMPF